MPSVSSPRPAEPALRTPPVKGEAASEERSAGIPWPLRLFFILSLLILLMASWAETLRMNALAPSRAAGVGSNDSLILPGERVGFITIGVPIAEVESRLGAGRIRPTERAVLYLFPNVGITCGVEAGRVTFISTRAPGFQLRTGISVGSDVEMVVRTFGDGYEYDRNTAGPAVSAVSGPAPKPAATPNGNSPRPVSPFGRTERGASDRPVTPTPSPTIPATPPVPVSNLQTESYILHYWEKGIHFNVHGSRIESILVTAPVGG